MPQSKRSSHRNKGLHTPSIGDSKRESYAVSMGGGGEHGDSCLNSSTTVVHPKISRTTKFLSDYAQFKAARKIQTMVRGFLARRQLRRKRCAAICIQREWRRFAAQRKYYRLLEQRVQEVIDEYHRKAAVKIQAYWRGFLVREHVHDQYRMKRSQRMAVGDLLECIAHKLHYLMRTHQIPGVYSLKDSNALSKVEKLLISISFKQGNKRSLITRLQRENDAKESRKVYQESAFGTKIPYAGPNFSGICPEQCYPIFKEPNIDARMHQILRKYESEELKQRSVCPSKPTSKTKRPSMPKKPPNFCGYVLKSMRRWKIASPNQFHVRPDVFKSPQNVAQFLEEIQSMYEFMNDPRKHDVKIPIKPAALK